MCVVSQSKRSDERRVHKNYVLDMSPNKEATSSHSEYLDRIRWSLTLTCLFVYRVTSYSLALLSVHYDSGEVHSNNWSISFREHCRAFALVG